MTTDPTRISLERFFCTHNDALIRFLTRLTRCRATAEDVAQLAWLKVLRAESGGQPVAPDEMGRRAYLFRVARNTFLDECTRKHEATRSRAVDPMELARVCESVSDMGNPEDDLQREQTGVLLRRAIGCLPDEQRAVIEMWCAGTSIRAMASQTAAPWDTVLSRKKYALARMRSDLTGLSCAV